MDDMWTYKGWSISFDHPPIPTRDFDWGATSPDYDVDCDQDGFFHCGGQHVHAATYEELLVEIEDAIVAERAEVTTANAVGMEPQSGGMHKNTNPKESL